MTAELFQVAICLLWRSSRETNKSNSHLEQIWLKQDSARKSQSVSTYFQSPICSIFIEWLFYISFPHHCQAHSILVITADASGSESTLTFPFVFIHSVSALTSPRLEVHRLTEFTQTPVSVPGSPHIFLVSGGGSII